MDTFLNNMKQYLIKKINKRITTETDTSIITGLDEAKKIVEDGVDNYIKAYFEHEELEERKLQDVK